MKFSAKLRRGFTLIELLIVIVIIGILAVGLVPKVLDAPKRARDAVRKADLNSIRTALEQYAVDKSTYPADISNTTLGTYFANQTTPVPPAGTTATTYTYTKITGSTCSYALSVILETKSGNASVPTTTCTVTNTAGTTQSAYFGVVGG